MRRATLLPGREVARRHAAVSQGRFELVDYGLVQADEPRRHLQVPIHRHAHQLLCVAQLGVVLGHAQIAECTVGRRQRLHAARRPLFRLGRAQLDRPQPLAGLLSFVERVAIQAAAELRQRCLGCASMLVRLPQPVPNVDATKGHREPQDPVRKLRRPPHRWANLSTHLRDFQRMIVGPTRTRRAARFRAEPTSIVQNGVAPLVGAWALHYLLDDGGEGVRSEGASRVRSADGARVGSGCGQQSHRSRHGLGSAPVRAEDRCRRRSGRDDGARQRAGLRGALGGAALRVVGRPLHARRAPLRERAGGPRRAARCASRPRKGEVASTWSLTWPGAEPWRVWWASRCAATCAARWPATWISSKSCCESTATSRAWI